MGFCQEKYIQKQEIDRYCLLNFQQLHKNLLSDLVQLPSKSGPAIRILFERQGLSFCA